MFQSDSATNRDIVAGPGTLTTTDLQEIVFEWTLPDEAKGAVYQIWFNVDILFVVKGWTVTDSPRSVFNEDDDSGYFVDITKLAKGRGLSATLMASLGEVQTDVISDLKDKRTICNVAAYNPDDGYVYRIASPLTEWQNFADSDRIFYDPLGIGDSSYWDFSGPGFWWRPSAPWDYERCVMVRGIIRASSASQEAKAKFIVNSDSGYSNDFAESEEITITSTTPAWYSVDFAVPVSTSPLTDSLSSQMRKVDLLVKDSERQMIDIQTVKLVELATQGKARPSIIALDTESVPPSVANLPARMTINGVTKTPDFRYNLYDGTVSALPKWGYGADLAIAGSGAAVTPNQGSPLLGSLDGSVLFNAAKYYQASENNTGDIGTEDFVFEFVFKHSATAARLFDKYGSGVSRGVAIYTGTTLGVYLLGVSSNTTITSGNLTASSWYHAMVFVDASGSAQIYINGVASGSARSAQDGSYTNTEQMAIGARSNAANPYDSNMAYCAMWKGSNWLDTHLQATVAAERFAKLQGVYPQRALGTAIPTVNTRASSRYIRKYDSVNEQYDLFKLGDNWLPIERILCADSVVRDLYWPESQVTNKILQSQAFATTWSKLDAGDTVTNNAATAPDDSTTATSLIGDATDGDHGVSQAVTVTAATWVLSVFAKKGNKNWLYISDDTVVNATGYFDLDNGVIGTKGAGATSIGIIDYGDFYRCYIVFTGTAAAHTFKIQTADDDEDKTVQGNGSTVNTYLWGAQLELGNYPTSYIPTTTGAVIRYADQLRFKGDDGNLGGVGSELQGTVECEVYRPNVDNAVSRFILSLSDGGSANDLLTLQETTGDVLQLDSASSEGNAGQVTGTTGISSGALHILKAQWKVNKQLIKVGGSPEGTPDEDCSIAGDLDRIDVACDRSGQNQLNGGLRKLKIYPVYGAR